MYVNKSIQLELKLRKRMGNKTFNETFPNRFLVPENADSNFGYVKEEVIMNVFLLFCEKIKWF